jgi:osmotically-inducible protein OsmY
MFRNAGNPLGCIHGRRVCAVLCLAALLSSSVGLAAETEPYLASAIREQLESNRALGIRELTVEVSGGEVTIRGVVGNLQARNTAEKSIRNRVGVSSVINLLRIENAEGGDGPEDDVAAALAANPYLSGREIRASVAGDSVWLDGVVESAFQFEQAGAAAAQAPGVGTVVNRIRVDESPFSAAEAGLTILRGDDPAVRALINSYYDKLGVNPELTVRINRSNMAEGWQDSVEIDPPRPGGKPIVINPETGYYEYFDIYGLGVAVGWYLVSKAFGIGGGKDND